MLSRGAVVRVGDTVRRPRRPGSEVVEALLAHLERVGFGGAPRFLGVDDQGRQTLTFIDGDVWARPAWHGDDSANAAELGRVAARVRALHDATATFVAPAGATPQRPLPLAGDVWSHGDVGYGNTVYRDGVPVAFIDWEFAAPTIAEYDIAALYTTEVRGPRHDSDGTDATRRAVAIKAAFDAVAAGYGSDALSRQRLVEAGIAGLHDAAAFWAARPESSTTVALLRWRADWIADHEAWLAS